MNTLKVIILLLSLSLISGCKSSKTASSGKSQKEYESNDLVTTAKKHLGTRYRAGGSNPSTGFDCSGFTKYVFSQFGIKLPPSSADQAEFGKVVPLEKADKGDLIFFKGGDEKSKKVGHVGIVIGGKGDDLQFIHASTSKGIMISKLGEKYFKVRFVRIRRVR